MKSVPLILLLLLVAPATAHEYWIEPKTYTFQIDAKVVAGLFNGQNFSGGEFTYFPKTFRRFDLALGDQIAAVPGRVGDKPALSMAPLGDGLHVALYESAGEIVFYSDFAKFQKFVNHKDFKTAIARHKERGLAENAITEFYTRHSKALLAVASGTGQDRAYGLETEIVALKNPYVDDVTQGMPVRVLYRGTPRADAQIELFDKNATGQVEITLLHTDKDGVAVLPVIKGHSYLADAVVLREPEAGSKAELSKAQWETLWAALTFGVPD